MTSEIPSHHIKQNVCGTRPRYREGRFPKAVKVYTINDESRYLLIQGVPSVGASEELLKVCESYGCIDEHYALDDYPCEDEYTEVYLMKYKKIQSARFAKRKLDDYSFFGGTLHVCYAPEYESVNETKEKLQERRRIVAVKIHQHTNNRGPPSSQPEERRDTSHHQVTDSHTVETPHNKQPDFTNHMNKTSPAMSSHPSSSCSSSIAFTTQAASGAEKNMAETCYPQDSFETFALPPPPKLENMVNRDQPSRNSKYSYSRVPSAHATLPAGYDGRLQPVLVTQDLKTSAESKSSQKSVGESEPGIIVKQYNPSKKPPKFVPRQAVKRPHEECSPNAETKNNHSELLDQEIKRNAFSLGQVQGPEDMSGRKTDAASDAVKSVNQTIHNIRSKISKLISDSVNKSK